jgi:aspartate 1-decarboxylase
MQVFLLRGKIHRATVTDANVDYEGSMTVDQDLMDQVRLYPYEKVLVSNMANGARFETYLIPGKRGGREIILNGATAHRGKVGDRLTIMAYTLVPEEEAPNWKPRVIVVDGENRVTATR